MDGILNINKPCGQTSFSIVAIIKRLSGEQHIGHAGTLDPLATGVLPVCLGRGTRVTEFLMDATKTYQAQIELGVATDTYDCCGKITQKGDPSRINQAQLDSALASFRGSIQQIPPMYSAVKHHGQPLYELARAGITIERKSRLIKIFNLDLIDWQPPVATIKIECSKGTYIRTLAHDLGQSLGCGANLKSLIRLRCGLFDIKNAISLPQLKEAFLYGYWHCFVYPLDSVISHWQAMVVNDSTENTIRRGGFLALEDDKSDEGVNDTKQHETTQFSDKSPCRVYTIDGRFLGVLSFNAKIGQWQPKKVFP